MPDHSASLEEVGQFWDTHDLTDYDDLLEEVRFEVDLKERVFLTALEPDLAKRLTHHARQEGIPTETLIHLWLSEKLAGAKNGH